MKASRLIEILAHHMNDRDGGDFDVQLVADEQSKQLLESPGSLKSVERCWLYPGLKAIIIST